jgi:uncharacterized protein YnzC (UPF0291/DUF896 family)
MDHAQLVQRINELSRKSKTTQLTEEEKAEQQKLRKRYIEAFKTSLKNQLDVIEIVDKE